MKPILKYALDLKIVGVALLYFLAARLGFFLVFDDSYFLPTWPPSGIALALLIILGRNVWPGITIGALLANIMAYWNTGDLAPNTIVLLSSVIALGYTLEALLGNFLIKKLIRSEQLFHKTRDTFRFLFVSMLVTSLGAGICSLALYANGVIFLDEWLKFFLSIWVGNVVGILLFTPFFLSLRRPQKLRVSLQKSIETGIILVLIVGMVFLIQVDYIQGTLERAMPFLVFPFLLWMAFRFELAIALSGALLTALVAVFYTIGGLGPFVLNDSYNSMLLLQIFIGAISISTIIVSSTVKEKAEAQGELRAFNENLEGLVQERTKELEEQIKTRKKAEEKLQKTNTELRKTNVELDHFVYSVSHDLRSPIASVLGLINLAKKDKDTKMKDTYLEMIHKSALQQDEFIQEILDQSKNSRLELKGEEVMFDSLINETFNQLSFAFAHESVVRDVKVIQRKPFVCDRWRLKVILSNLLSNAIRYRNGKDPQVKVNVSIHKGLAKLEISDNGRGIKEEHLEHVYKMFYRATDENAGSGLGLYIVKEAVEKLQGHIQIESQEGKGTTVSLEIPEIKEKHTDADAFQAKLS